MSSPSDVFLDLSGRRWRRFWGVFTLVTLAGLAAAIAFVDALWITPGFAPPREAMDLRYQLSSLIEQERLQTPAEHPPEWLRRREAHARAARPVERPTETGVVAGFYVDWDPNSLADVRAHADALTHVIPERFRLTGVPARIEPIEVAPEFRALVREHGLHSIALLTNLKGDAWQPEAVETLLRRGPIGWATFAGELVGHLKAGGDTGVLFDLQQVDPVYRDDLSRFAAALARTLHDEGLELWFAVPVGRDSSFLDLEALATSVDRFLAMLYDENGEEDAPGPIASQPWFQEWLEAFLGFGSPAQWVIGVGAYAYDWPAGGKAETISFVDAMTRAQAVHPVEVQAVAPAFSPHFSYTEGGRKHHLWFQDAVTFRNQAALARARGVGGLALHRLGAADPGVWQVLRPEVPPGALAELPSSDQVAHLGRGDFITLQEQRQPGQREVKAGPDGLWSERYQRFPAFPTLFHEGFHEGAAENRVAITFDDGPDPEWTPQILDVLKAKGAPAAFFVVGAAADSHPELLRRIQAEGHEVGVHTYFHPNLAEVSPTRIVLELNATQRLLEGNLQRSTVLFRPPYNVDNRPTLWSEIAPLAQVQALGYVTVTQSIDTLDWERPGVETILNRVKEGRAYGNVLLMHDSGGDRTQSVEALGRIIDYLRARGDEVVPLSGLIGVTPERLMPPIQAEEPLRLTTAAFDLIHWLERFFWAFMVVATGLVLLRTLIIAWLALRQRQAPPEPLTLATARPVSVLLAAYNEGKVIDSTLASLLASTYPGELEVLVVDDGSSDDTALRVAAVAATEPRVRLIRQANRGKARALQHALAEARHDWLVLLDADTQFEPDTIPRLVRYLTADEVAAVSGHVKVGNRGSWLGRFQSLEYTCGFNLDRRAYDALNCVTVVPGAACALKRPAVLAVGGIPDDTLAEDTDLTLALHRAGYRIRHAPEAVAWTEAPESVSALARQRVRWSFGVLQSLWKHRDLVFNPRFGALAFFSLPSILFFQILLVGLIPLVDALLIISLIWGHGLAIVNYALVFLLVDLALALLACALEPEPLRRAAYILPMRLLYRPLLAYAVWKSLLRALRGGRSGWSKLERTGAVSLGGAR